MSVYAQSLHSFLFIFAMFQPGAERAASDVRVLQGSVWVEGTGGKGTGAFVSKERRLVLIDLAVVGEGDEVEVYFPKMVDGQLMNDPDAYTEEGTAKSYSGRVIERDQEHRIALIELDDLPAKARPIRLSAVGAKPQQSVKWFGMSQEKNELWAFQDHIVSKVEVEHVGSKDLKIVKVTKPWESTSSGLVTNDDGELVGLSSTSGPHPAPATGAIDVTEVEDLVKRHTDGYYEVTVFYATDRLPAADVGQYWARYFRDFFLTLNGIIASAACLVLGVLMLIFIKSRKRWWGIAVILIPPFLFAPIYTLQRIRDLPEPGMYYSSEWGDVEYGQCKVSIPKDHRMGELESPTEFFLYRAKENPKEHVSILDVIPKAEAPFFEQLKSAVRQSAERQAFVFVHGYNTTFKDAARRTAQMFYDLDFDGAPIFYSWPSQGLELAYTMDENTINRSIPHFEQFLKTVAQKTGATNIHVIAHSMGNRILTRSLQRLALRSEFIDNSPFREIILAAPDIDANVFKNDIAPEIMKVSRRVTLYASSNDTALNYSKTVHGDPRAGEAGASLVVVEGMDTVDASELDTSLSNHSYFGDHDSVLSDIYYVIKGGAPADRFGLTLANQRDLEYWVFRKR